MLNRTVPAAAEGLPMLTMPADLSALGMEDLFHALDAVRTLANVCAALCMQPRLRMSVEGLEFTPGGALLDGVNDALCDLQQRLVDEAMNRKSRNADDAEARAWIVFAEEGTARDSIPHFAATVSAELARLGRGAIR